MHARTFALAVALTTTAAGGCGPDSSSDSGDPVYCTAVGPPCGLTIEFDDAGLELGTYAITIETSQGTTSCSYAAEPVRFQTAQEAVEQDTQLAQCGADNSCPRPCEGPDRVYPRMDGLTVEGGSESISVVIENIDTGAQTSKTFAPDYSPHPAQAGDCHQCDVAMDTMPVPAAN